MEIDWRKTITSDPEVLLGKPVVKGTRLSVELILGLFAEGWTEGQVLEEYPNLTDADIRAIFAFATECMREESLYPLDSKQSDGLPGQREHPPVRHKATNGKRP